MPKNLLQRFAENWRVGERFWHQIRDQRTKTFLIPYFAYKVQQIAIFEVPENSSAFTEDSRIEERFWHWIQNQVANILRLVYIESKNTISANSSVFWIIHLRVKKWIVFLKISKKQGGNSKNILNIFLEVMVTFLNS